MSQTNDSNQASDSLNHRISAGTDGASFFIYHPQDLNHRLTSPLAWSFYHFACRPEFEAGRLVAFTTGGDGGDAFRITDGPLTEREKTWLAGSWDFRYVVRHGRTYLDGGYALPSSDYFDESEKHPQQWITLPNGNYRVTVNAIEWYSEPSALDENNNLTENALASYVIQFQPVESLESIKISSTPPRLETSKNWPAIESGSFAELDTFEEEKIELKENYVVQIAAKQAPIPGFHITLETGEDFHHAIYGSKGHMMLPDRIQQLVIASSHQTPCLGVLAEPSGASRRNNGPWKLSFHAKRFVEVFVLEPTKPWMMGTVNELYRPSSTPSEEQLNALKQTFATYAQSNSNYQQNIEYPEFEVERVLAMNSATGITHVLIHHVQMPVAEQLKMLPLSDAERIQRLFSLMAVEE